jgi:hypothetical protein
MEIGLLTPPVGATVGPKKNPSLVHALGFRLSHKRARSVDPLKSSSGTDGQTDRQSADNSVFFQNLKIR